MVLIRHTAAEPHWRAVFAAQVPRGQAVLVLHVQGLRLHAAAVDAGGDDPAVHGLQSSVSISSFPAMSRLMMLTFH